MRNRNDGYGTVVKLIRKYLREISINRKDMIYHRKEKHVPFGATQVDLTFCTSPTHLTFLFSSGFLCHRKGNALCVTNVQIIQML